MNQLTYTNYFFYLSVAIALSAFTYWIVLTIQDWLAANKEQERMHQDAVNKYIAQQNEQIESLRDGMRQYMTRELQLLQEQQVSSARIKFLATELAIDGKETQVFRR